jgi:hypothetical protein
LEIIYRPRPICVCNVPLLLQGNKIDATLAQLFNVTE